MGIVSVIIDKIHPLLTMLNHQAGGTTIDPMVARHPGQEGKVNGKSSRGQHPGEYPTPTLSLLPTTTPPQYNNAITSVLTRTIDPAALTKLCMGDTCYCMVLNNDLPTLLSEAVLAKHSPLWPDQLLFCLMPTMLVLPVVLLLPLKDYHEDEYGTENDVDHIIINDKLNWSAPSHYDSTYQSCTFLTHHIKNVACPVYYKVCSLASKL